ncbi:MAG: GDCCVxC domain-containing (seleno)protein [Promethearchaeota archaeon]
MKITSKLTCPKCSFTETLEMPVDHCVVLHKCINCQYILQPKNENCCIFCSYGDTPCPSKQST